MALEEDKRTQLDGIVSQMQANSEPDSNIQLVVDDFKKKYDSPSFMSKVGGVAKAAGSGILKAADWFGHLGQPQAAKDLVTRIGKAEGPTSKFQPPYSEYSGNPEALQQTTPSIAPEAAAAVDMATSPMSYAGLATKLPGWAAAALRASKGLEHGAAVAESGLTGKSVAALKTASTGPGGKAIIEAGKSKPEIAQALVDASDNAHKFINKGTEAAVRAPETAAGRIDIRPVLQAFDDAKVTANDFGGNTQIADKVNSALDAEKRSIGGNLFGSDNGSVSFQRTERTPYSSSGNPQSVKPAMRNFTESKSAAVGPATDVNGMTDYTIPATQLREIKTSIGKGINWDAPESAPLKAKMKGIYAKIDDELIKAVNLSQGEDVATQYQHALANWSNKINDFKELDSKLGRDPSTRLDRAMGLIAKEPEKRPGLSDLLESIDSHAGTDISKRAELARMADEFTKTKGGKILNPNQIGKPAILPSKASVFAEGGAAIPLHYSGVPPWAIAALEVPTIAASSPRLATKAIIPAARNLPFWAESLMRHSPVISAAGAVNRSNQ